MKSRFLHGQLYTACFKKTLLWQKLLTLPSKAGEDRPFKTITSPVNSTLVTYYPPPSKNITQGEQKSVHITQIKNTIIRK